MDAINIKETSVNCCRKHSDDLCLGSMHMKHRSTGQDPTISFPLDGAEVDLVSGAMRAGRVVCVDLDIVVVMGITLNKEGVL